MYKNKRVAVLAPSSAQGELGGAERFYAGLLQALRQTGCSADLVQIHADESSFEAILRTYERCRNLDLSEYDLVISTKAPTFVVSHPNHVLYLVHTIRVFYDMFDQAFPWADETLLKQRETILKIDTEAMGRISQRFSIGHEVSKRLRHWNGHDAEVLHPPLATQGFRCGADGDYFFLPGRLHAWKRIDLVIRALQRSKLPLRLVIAGIGEAEDELKALAAGDPRICFLGRVDDSQLLDLYADSLAVPFVPVREDYGYITLEAFASGKPVITCRDSGEPLQFVVDGQTGLVCDPTPESLCAAMEELFNDRARARSMGQQGARRVEDITWPSVAEHLLRAGFGRDRSAGPGALVPGEPMKVAIVDMQPIDPAVGGGRLRLLGLYHALGADIDARYVGTYDWPGEKYRHHRLSPGLEEINVPLSDAHHQAANSLAEQAGSKTVIDLAFPRQAHLSPEYLAKVREAIDWAHVVVFSHPWVYPLVRSEIRDDQVVVYDAHNVEGVLRAQILDAGNPIENDLLRCVVETEYAAGRGSDLILTCSEHDVDLFQRVYGWSRDRMSVVPNGVMASAITPATDADRTALRARLGIDQFRSVAFFIGSNYAPNVEAANFIIRSLAPSVPNVLFVIAGGVGQTLAASIPNVKITGLLDDSSRNDWLRASDVALNPMFAGSGTNIKMFDFMAAGLPIVTTAIGARGIANVTGGGLKLATGVGFVGALTDLLAEGERLRELGLQNRRWVDQEFAWERISPRLGDALRKLADKAQATRESARPLRLAHLSTVGQVCGVGEYTARLLSALVAEGVPNYLVTCATPVLRPLASQLPAQAEVGWHYDDISWRDSYIDDGVSARAAKWGADHMIVQYHPAFFSGPTLFAFADSCLRHGIGVAVVVHNFSLVDLPSFRQLAQLGCLLVVHSRREVLNASANDIPVAYLPLLVPTPGGLAPKSLRGRDLRHAPPVIASTGFIRPHKGLPQLIEALPLVQLHYPGTRLLLQCSLYPSTDSQLEYELCRKRVHELGLEKWVEFDTEFRPIEEVHRRLADADLAILPYGPSNEGGSAAAATVLASGVPLLVSQSRVLDEVASGSERLADTEPLTIAETVCRLLDQPTEYDELARRTIAYANAHSAAGISKQLLQLLRSSSRASISSTPFKEAA